MSRSHVISLTLGLTAGFVTDAASQIEVTASVDETTIGTEEVGRYTILIAGAAFSEITNPAPPSASGLTLVQRAASTQQNISIVNSEVQQSISFTWQFRPDKAGEARIGSARVTVAGRQYTTDPITLNVVPQDQRPSRRAQASRWRVPDLGAGEQVKPPGISDTDVFIRAVSEKETVYQNEQLVLSYNLYFGQGVLLRNSRLADSWDTEGFWREDLDVEQRATMRTEIINGLRYNAVTLKRVALFPTRSGPLTVEPLRIESEVALPRGSSAFRSLLFGRTARFQSASVASPAVKVVSRALPAPPADFHGVVGDLSIRTTVNRREVEAGEPVQLTVVLRGRGNIATLAEPPLELPPLIDQFGPEVTDSIDRSREFVSGSKTFLYTLVPRSAGRHTIPGFSIPYFHPETGEYRRLESSPIPIYVTGAIVPVASNVPTSRFPIDDIAPPHDVVSGWVDVDRNPIHENRWPYLTLFFPLVGLAILYLYRKHVERIAVDQRYARSRRAHPAAKKHLKEAEKLLAAGHGRELYDEISRAVLGFVGDRIDIAPQGMTQGQLRRSLAEKGLSRELVDDTVAIIDECERARFSPESPDAEMMQDVVERAAGLIAGIHEEVRRNGITA